MREPLVPPNVQNRKGFRTNLVSCEFPSQMS
jgi:hypothetical protein